MMRVSGKQAWQGVQRVVMTPVRGMAALGRFALRSLGRALAIDLQQVRLTEREQRGLATQPQEVGQYLAWRRGVLFIAVFLLGINLSWQVKSFIDLAVQARIEAMWTIWLYVLEAIRLSAVALLPLVAAINCLWWRQLRWNKHLLLIGMALAFVVPILLSAVPLHVVLDWDQVGDQFYKDFQEELDKAEIPLEHRPMRGPAHDEMRPVVYWIVDMVGAVIYTSLLIPTVFALFPGVLRACVRVKTLLPGAITPGWFLLSVVPLYLVFAIIVIAALNVVFQSPMLTTSLALFLVAPLLYLLNARSLLRPWRSAWRRRLTFVLGWLAMVLNLAALVLVVSYLATKEFAVLGYIGEVKKILGRSAEEALFDYWDLSFFLADYFGRTLFLMVAVADLLLTATVAFWRHLAAGDEERVRGFAGVLGKSE